MHAGVGKIPHEYRRQRKAYRHQGFPRDPADLIVQDGGQHIDDGQAAQTEYQKPFRADPAVQVQEISAVIPPALAIMGYFQVQGGKILHAAAQDHDSPKFQQRPGSQPVQRHQDQHAAAAVDRQPGTMEHTPVDKHSV